MPIEQNQVLFHLLGTSFGGDGKTNFALPDLRGATPIHAGQGFTLGQKGGEVQHTLMLAELPAHVHSLSGTTTLGTQFSPAGNALASTSQPSYGPPVNLTPFAPGAVSAAGGAQPHQNMQPYLTLSFCIALRGDFPSQ